MKLKLKVVPGASRDIVEGWLGDALKIRVRAAPEKGRANEAVTRLLAEALNVPLDRVKILSGFTSGRKVAEIDGVTAEGVNQVFCKPR